MMTPFYGFMKNLVKKECNFHAKKFAVNLYMVLAEPAFEKSSFILFYNILTVISFI